MSKPRVAIIGYGRWGRQCHTHLISRAPNLELFGIASSDPEKQAAIKSDVGCGVYSSFDEAIADSEVDVVVLATPSQTHAPYSIRALDAGKHVVTDKVMCLSLEECDAMIEAARRNNRVLTVFQNRRRDGDFLTLKHLMESGELGEVRWLEMAWQGFGPWGGWRGQIENGGGRFYDLGAHLLDQLLVLFPEKVESVFCRMHHDFETTNVESEALVIVTFEGGKTGVCDLSSLAAISKPRFYAHGSNATFIKYGLDPQEEALKAGDIELAQENPDSFGRLKSKTEERVVPTLPGRWRDFYENLAAVLTEGAEPLVGLDEARRTMSVIDAALNSAQSGEVVRLS